MRTNKRTKKIRKKMSISQLGKQVGEKNGNSKLTDKQREEIKNKYLNNITYKNLAEEYGVNISTIRRIVLK